MVAASRGGTRPETRRAVYDYIHAQGMATKQDIASALSLSLPTVSKYVSHFLRTGFIEKKAKLASGENGGRNPVAYACVPGARFAIGMDINAVRVSSLIVDLNGNVVHRLRTDRRFQRGDDYLRFLGVEIDALLATSGLERESVLGVGIAIPALVNAVGEVFYGKVIDVLGMTVRDFSRHIGLRCQLMHDSGAAGLAEFLSDPALSNAFYLSLGNSVGGSILIGGQIYSGDGVFSGEIGHLTVLPDGRECYCGRRGCLDPYVNASVLAEAGGGDVESFFTRLTAGDDVALDVWHEYSAILARAIHDIRTLFGCRVILGGEVGAHLQPLLPALGSAVDTLSFRHDPARDYLATARHRAESIAAGAALYFVDEFRQDPGALERA